MNTVSTTFTHQIPDSNLEVRGFSNTRAFQVGSLTKTQTAIALVAITAIAILGAYLFSFVPGLSGLTSFMSGAALFGVLWVSVAPPVKSYLFERDTIRYIESEKEAIQNLLNLATDQITLPENRPGSMDPNVGYFSENGKTVLEIHRSKGALLSSIGDGFHWLGKVIELAPPAPAGMSGGE